MPDSDLEQIREPLEAALRRLGAVGKISLSRLRGGRNNRVYRVDAGDQQFAAKRYFTSADQSHDRLAAEYGFCEFAWRNGISFVPRPLVRLASENLAVYEFLDGQRLTADAVNRPHVEAAIEFWRQVNKHKHQQDARRLPSAAEACFSLTEHLHCVDRRVAALQRVEPADPDHAAALEFATGELAPTWNELRQSILESAIEGRIDPSKSLHENERCLSPSDFGFHNALVQPNGEIRFLDFEYAGWDDPAKAVCDFFCQPDVSAPLEFFDAFAAAIVGELPNAGEHRRRIDLLLPVYRLKWCCILLNDFLPAGRRRREFGDASALNLPRQWAHAQAALKALRNTL